MSLRDFYFLLPFIMAHTEQGSRPATQDETPSAHAPIERIKLGNVTVSVFENEANKNGKSFEYYNVSIQRSYYDAIDKTWHDTSSLKADDLLPAAVALQKAYVLIEGLKKS